MPFLFLLFSLVQANHRMPNSPATPQRRTETLLTLSGDEGDVKLELTFTPSSAILRSCRETVSSYERNLQHTRDENTKLRDEVQQREVLIDRLQQNTKELEMTIVQLRAEVLECWL